VRSFYDEAVERVESFLDQRVVVSANGTSGVSAKPTRNGTLGSATTSVMSTVTLSGSSPVTSTGLVSPENMGSARRMEVGVGMGVAIGLAGLLAL
jgi:hypothetical protein